MTIINKYDLIKRHRDLITFIGVLIKFMLVSLFAGFCGWIAYLFGADLHPTIGGMLGFLTFVVVFNDGFR